ncbi:5-dehydro-4-deoxy-D-glucuronate isomerase [Microbulbifer hydrolyticus]|uniref:5-dehydro-4-deoxy-D-glucuronate isomerase n=1 Tax=Microbulbifer hydrolyticus TaxID=48074 RepID=A0A6P1TEG1_9GAMM|nr:5-dehydro-4-deoxy-D-glucuronate isomerase [Microbulbifer hydrolyticus]MBB5213024.1 4-deoxy-L-threo-5-hexosulose-uronate ketol-isomerase [Microbulbifer hydrolyticus]QHQ40387.1 5-dehydro-4-deoxy-D-glucuronate isomerase [Microbulbifer hydrolyticus]
MNFLQTADSVRYQRMTSAELRENFCMEGMFRAGELNLTYTDVDRALVGAAVPLKHQPLSLPTHKELASDYFCERREVGVVNLGESGRVEVDGKSYVLAPLEFLYISRGSRTVNFFSDGDTPAEFYLVSYPAHRETETVHVTMDKANTVELGSIEGSNERVIYQAICPGVVDSCQLVMGVTRLSKGSVWNTKPPHTHRRRTEVYLYFDFPEDERVFHFMGQPHETRSLPLAPKTAIASPYWSIHSGAGSCNYSFVWAMGGENQQFDDMDHLSLGDLG